MTLTDAVEQYLGSRRSTLWGRHWDLSQPEERRKAAKWFVTEFQQIKEFVEDATEH